MDMLIYFLSYFLNVVNPNPPMSPTLTGQTVTITYESNLAIGHGHFELNNPDDSPLSASVKHLWLKVGDERQLVQPVTVWDREEQVSLDPQSFQVSANDSLEFYMTFPQITDQPAVGESVGVVLQLQVGEVYLEATSPIELVRRWRR